METTLLYILHWFLLDAAEECAESDMGIGTSNNPFYYLYSVPTITVINIFLYIQVSQIYNSYFYYYSCLFIYLLLFVITWKILILKQIYDWKMELKFGHLWVNLNIQKQLVLQLIVNQSQDHFGWKHQKWINNNSEFLLIFLLAQVSYYLLSYQVDLCLYFIVFFLYIEKEKNEVFNDADSPPTVGVNTSFPDHNIPSSTKQDDEVSLSNNHHLNVCNNFIFLLE